MRSLPVTSLRVNEAAIRAVLDQLDKQVDPIAANKRRSERYSYRVSATIELVTPEGPAKDAVMCRDLSRDGMAFLTGRFVYPKTACRVRLVSEHNQALQVEGVVVRCRYISGTVGIHEVGVAFSGPIDIGLFHRGASSVRVLLADPDTSQSELLAALMRRCGATVDVVGNLNEAIEVALRSPFDLVVLNELSSQQRGCQMVRALRERGYVRPITSVTALREASTHATCQAQACSRCHPTALTRESLIGLVRDIKSEPVLSSLSHDPSAATVINQFVSSLQAQIERMEAEFADGGPDALIQLLGRFAVFAEAAGFELLVEEGERLMEACKSGDAVRVRNGLGLFIRRCLAARPASQVHIA